jgi:hypothetical protein
VSLAEHVLAHQVRSGSSWTLHVATGQPYICDSDLIQAAYGFVESTVAQNPNGSPGLFGPPVSVAKGAPFLGSASGLSLTLPVNGIIVTGDSFGYWLVAFDGGVFTFGDATFRGSLAGQPLNPPLSVWPLNSPVVTGWSDPMELSSASIRVHR